MDPDTAAKPTAPPVPWRRRCRRAFLTGALGGALLTAAFFALWVYPFWGFPFNASRHTRVPITPPWALECWLWEDNANSADAVRELLEGFAEHDIPVRTIVLDSPWSRRYNDFVVDEQRYPQPAQFFHSLQDRGYRVVLWMTCMVNRRNKDSAERDSTEFFEEAKARGFLAGHGAEISWWKGRGGFIDYTHPDALDWWHGLQQQVLSYGIDGWKLDGTDTFFSSWGFLPWQRTHAGWITTREYMDLYNREEFRHGLSHNPEFVVLTRAIDNRYFPLGHPEGFSPLDAAPVTWVGDRTHEWSSKTPAGDAGFAGARRSKSVLDRGFEGALRDILASADKGYCVVGDEVGGYHGRGSIEPALYIRWAQFAAFTGLFLNGGHGERRVWKRSPEELELFRKFAWLHTELVPYLYTHVVRCHGGGRPLLRPTHDTYQFYCGDELYVAPIYRDEPTRTVRLPPGRWRHLLRDDEVFEGPTTLTREYSLADFPVFIRDGGVLPLEVSRSYTGFGDAESAGYLTWVIEPWGRSEFTVENTDRSGPTRVRVDATGSNLNIAFDGVRKPHILRIRRDTKPTSVELDGHPLSEARDWRYDERQHRLWVQTKTYDAGRYVIR